MPPSSAAVEMGIQLIPRPSCQTREPFLRCLSSHTAPGGAAQPDHTNLCHAYPRHAHSQAQLYPSAGGPTRRQARLHCEGHAGQDSLSRHNLPDYRDGRLVPASVGVVRQLAMSTPLTLLSPTCLISLMEKSHSACFPQSRMMTEEMSVAPGPVTLALQVILETRAGFAAEHQLSLWAAVVPRSQVRLPGKQAGL